MNREKPPEPKADPEEIHILDDTIQSHLKMARFQEKIDAVDAVYLLVKNLPKWLGVVNEEFVVDQVRAAFAVAREKGAKK